MPVDPGTSNLWLARKAVPGVDYALNESVIANVEGRCLRAAIITLLETEPDVIYLVETVEGADIHVRQSDLLKIDNA
jgi:hypothetical protein